MDDAAVLDAIRSYKQSFDRTKFTCEVQKCPGCRLAPRKGTSFRRHGVRTRTLLVIADRSIYKTVLRLVRWRCRRCLRTFMPQPPFMMRHKHYVLPQMRLRAGRYAGDKTLSYRGSVCVNSLPIFRWDGDANRIQPNSKDMAQTLAHTTVIRWITSMAELVPSSKRSRGRGISEGKYRTRARERKLLAFMGFLGLEE